MEKGVMMGELSEEQISLVGNCPCCGASQDLVLYDPSISGFAECGSCGTSMRAELWNNLTMRLFFTIGTIKHNVTGHGDNYSSIVIERDGMYESGKFPPLFLTKQDAETYLESLVFKVGKSVVELEIASK